MTPSEAFAAWIDGKRVQIERQGEWYDVIEFDLTARGLFVEATNGTRVRGVARTFPFRLADAPTKPKPTVEDSEAWGLLRELVESLLNSNLLLSAQSRRNHDAKLSAAIGALKKRGML